jgi:hypothetical protein
MHPIGMKTVGACNKGRIDGASDYARKAPSLKVIM